MVGAAATGASPDTTWKFAYAVPSSDPSPKLANRQTRVPPVRYTIFEVAVNSVRPNIGGTADGGASLRGIDDG